MPVKCLNSRDQQVIIDLFSSGEYKIDALASLYCVSRRTIIRVLEDHAIDPLIKRRPMRVESYPPAQLDLEPELSVIPTKTPWWKKLFPFLYSGGQLNA